MPAPEAWLLGELAAETVSDPARVLRFRHWPDRYRTLAAERLIRHALRHELGYAADEMRIGRDRSGRPFLAGPDGFTGDFNASHHGTLVGCAVVGSGSVGFDIVDPEEFTDPDLVSILHARERAYCNRLPGGAARTRFLARTWVLKEAYLKMVGTGLGVEPASICFDMEAWPRGLFQIACGVGHHPEFQVWERGAAMMAVAVSPARAALAVHEVSWEGLFPSFPGDGENEADCAGAPADRVSGVGRKS